MTTAATDILRSPLHGRAPLAAGDAAAGPAAAIRDLSPCARTGFKGSGTNSWLGAFAPELPERPNLLTRGPDGLVIGRLAQSEFVLLSERPGAHALIERVDAAWSAERPADCYRVPKADGQAMIGLTGGRAFELLAKMSPVDFRPQVFPPGSIAQTTCARVTVQILHLASAVSSDILLLVDTSYAIHLWDCLADAMREFGTVQGVAAPEVPT